MTRKIEVSWFLLMGLIFLWFIPFFSYAETTTRASEKDQVHAFFADNPAMVEIAHCESGTRQTTDSGSVLRGGLNNNMIGVFQLHEKYHRVPAQALGFDIDTLEGNLAYAKHLYAKEGLTPWKSCLHSVTSTQLPKPAESTTIFTDTREALIAQIEYLERKILLLKIELLTKQYELLKSKQKKSLL
jgi:hypothetical protein